MMRVLGSIDRFIEKYAAKLLVVSVLVMLGLSTFSIILRWAERSLLWIDPFVRCNGLFFFSNCIGQQKSGLTKVRY